MRALASCVPRQVRLENMEMSPIVLKVENADEGTDAADSAAANEPAATDVVADSRTSSPAMATGALDGLRDAFSSVDLSTAAAAKGDSKQKKGKGGKTKRSSKTSRPPEAKPSLTQFAEA